MLNIIRHELYFLYAGARLVLVGLVCTYILECPPLHTHRLVLIFLHLFVCIHITDFFMAIFRRYSFNSHNVGIPTPSHSHAPPSRNTRKPNTPTLSVPPHQPTHTPQLPTLRVFKVSQFTNTTYILQTQSAALCVLTPPSALSPIFYLLARVQYACRETWRTNRSLLLLAQEAPRLADRERELGERFVAVELVYQAAELVNLWVALRHCRRSGDTSMYIFTHMYIYIHICIYTRGKAVGGGTERAKRQREMGGQCRERKKREISLPS